MSGTNYWVEIQASGPGGLALTSAPAGPFLVGSGPAPSAVIGLGLAAVTPNPTANSIQISWSQPATGNGFYTYNLAYSVGNTYSFGPPFTGIVPTTFTLNGLLPASLYAFQVQAVDSVGQVGPWSTTGLWSTAATNTPVSNETPGGGPANLLSIVDSIGETFVISGSGGTPTPTPTAPATIDTGYIESLKWLNNTSHPITYFSVIYVVPPLPASNDGQILYLWGGIESSDAKFLLQPVLQWGGSGGPNWTLQTYWLSTNLSTGQVNPIQVAPATPIQVAPGTTIQCTITCTAGTRGQNNFAYTAQFVGYPTTAFSVSGNEELNFPIIALEAYPSSGNSFLASCSDYPNADFTTMGSIVVQTGTPPSLGSAIAPSWFTTVNFSDCGQGISGSGSSYNFYYRNSPSLPGRITRVIVIPFENFQLSDWMADSYFASLASKYGTALNFHGFSGLSLPSYLIETSGSNQGTTDDNFSFGQYNVTNIYDVLTAHGLTYENYEESGFQDNHRHTPGYFYPSTSNNVLDMSVFMSKYVNGSSAPPSYVWVTPNFTDDGHDSNVATASNWLKNTFKLDTLLAKPWFLDGSTLINIFCDDGGGSSPTTMNLMISTSSLGLSSNVSYGHANNLSTVMWLLGIPGSIGSSSASGGIKDLFNTVSGLAITAQTVAASGFTNPGSPQGATLSWNSGCISSCTETNGLPTAGLFARRYGYFEINCRVPKGGPATGPGFWPAFVLYPLSGPGELDIFEILGGSTTTVRQSIHNGQGTSHEYDYTLPNSGDTAVGLHRIGCDWQSDKITFYVDGVQTAQQATTSDMQQGTWYINIPFSVGGPTSWPGPPSPSTATSSGMFVINYVGVWASHATAYPSGDSASATPVKSAALFIDNFTSLDISWAGSSSQWISHFPFGGSEYTLNAATGEIQYFCDIGTGHPSSTGYQPFSLVSNA